jgi:hypothetical protein
MIVMMCTTVLELLNTVIYDKELQKCHISGLLAEGGSQDSRVIFHRMFRDMSCLPAFWTEKGLMRRREEGKERYIYLAIISSFQIQCLTLAYHISATICMPNFFLLIHSFSSPSSCSHCHQNSFANIDVLAPNIVSRAQDVCVDALVLNAPKGNANQ